MTDVYSRTNELDAQTLNVVVDRLEYRARQPIFLKVMEELESAEFSATF